MKRILSVISIGIIALALSGCVSDTQASAPTSKGSPSVEQPVDAGGGDASLPGAKGFSDLALPIPQGDVSESVESAEYGETISYFISDDGANFDEARAYSAALLDNGFKEYGLSDDENGYFGDFRREDATITVEVNIADAGRTIYILTLTPSYE